MFAKQLSCLKYFKYIKKLKIKFNQKNMAIILHTNFSIKFFLFTLNRQSNKCWIIAINVCIHKPEVHSLLNEYSNHKNCRIWYEEQAEAFQEPSIPSKKYTVSFVFRTMASLDCIFFKHDKIRYVTVNKARYHVTIKRGCYLDRSV